MTVTGPPSPVRPAPGRLLLATPRSGRPPRHLADLSLAERLQVATDLGELPFRGRQLSVHYFERFFDAARDDPAELTDLPAAARDRLSSALLPVLLTAARRLDSDAGTTVKTLWRLFDGALMESVLMRYPDRTTICVSSQAGCGMNCPFCATGQAGLTRNLSTAEIVEQVLAAARSLARGELAGGGVAGGEAAGSEGWSLRPGGGAPLGTEVGSDRSDPARADADRGARAQATAPRPTERDRSERVTNVVFMGMGEPLANYRAVRDSVRRITEPPPGGMGLSARGVTVSTVGLVPAIDRLATEGLPVTLALSLHAPDDDLRDELVPVNSRWKVAEALDAARRYAATTGRRVSIEYALIRGVNDQEWRADQLGRLLSERGRGWVHVNPIPLNPTPGSRWTASDPQVQDAFVRRLRSHGVRTTVRDTRGREIDGACGQLMASARSAAGLDHRVEHPSNDGQ